jgi:hypothetical protein
MDWSSDQPISEASRQGLFIAVMQRIKNITKWLRHLVVLTDEERRSAGIYHGGEGRT